jgi:hypothetical protein
MWFCCFFSRQNCSLGSTRVPEGAAESTPDVNSSLQLRSALTALTSNRTVVERDGALFVQLAIQIGRGSDGSRERRSSANTSGSMGNGLFRLAFGSHFIAFQFTHFLDCLPSLPPIRHCLPPGLRSRPELFRGFWEGSCVGHSESKSCGDRTDANARRRIPRGRHPAVPSTLPASEPPHWRPFAELSGGIANPDRPMLNGE